MVERKKKNMRIAERPGRMENIEKPGILRSQYFRFTKYSEIAKSTMEKTESFVTILWYVAPSRL